MENKILAKSTKTKKSENTKELQEIPTEKRKKIKKEVSETKERMNNAVQPKNETIKSPFRALFDSAVIIGIITGILYIVSFFYLKGFYNYYGLIDIEIDFSIYRILKTCLEIFKHIFLWIIIYSIQALNITRTKEKPTVENFIENIWIFLLSLFFIEKSTYSENSILRVLYAIGSFLIMFFYILVPVIFTLLPDKVKGKIPFVITKKTRFSLSYIYKIIAFLGSLYLIIDFIPNYGFNEARTKKDYLYDSKNQRILIYQDNEKSVFLPKNEDNTFEKKYIIVSSAELSELIFEHYENEVMFVPKIDNLEENQNMQDEEINNLLTEEPIE